MEKKSKTKTREILNPVFIFGSEAGKSLLEGGKSEAMTNSSKSFKCDQCKFTCEIPNTLKKQVNTKHTVHNCSLCSEELTTSMDLLSHISIEHHDEEEANGLNLQSTPKSKKGKQLSDSELDELLLEGYL